MISREKRDILENAYESDPYPNSIQIEDLRKRTELDENVIRVI